MRIEDPNQLYVPYTRGFHMAKNFCPHMKKVLFIGGGACLTPRNFIHIYDDIKVDVIEIDQKCIDIAKQQFNLKDDRRLKIIIDEGAHWFQTHKNKYDVIILDAYDGFKIPQEFIKIPFWNDVYSHLNDKGVVILNYFEHIQDDTYSQLSTLISSKFKEVTKITITPINKSGTNYLLVGMK